MLAQASKSVQEALEVQMNGGVADQGHMAMLCALSQVLVLDLYGEWAGMDRGRGREGERAGDMCMR